MMGVSGLAMQVCVDVSALNDDFGVQKRMHFLDLM